MDHTAEKTSAAHSFVAGGSAWIEAEGEDAVGRNAGAFEASTAGLAAGCGAS